jgi:uncharacterized protein (TIGR00369 family)
MNLRADGTMMDYEEYDPEYKKEMISTIQNLSPFWSLIGMELIDVKRGWARVRLPFAKKLTNAMGTAHGAALFAPVDSAVGVALHGLTDESETFTTVEVKVNYLKAVSDGEIIAEARITHKGSTIALGEVEVRNDAGDLIIKGMVTYMILKRRD